MRAIFGDIQTILMPDAEFARNRDHRLVAETHSDGNRRLVALHEVRPLVAVHADPVSCAMRKARHLVSRSESGLLDHRARRSIHSFARSAHLDGAEGSSLS